MTFRKIGRCSIGCSHVYPCMSAPGSTNVFFSLFKHGQMRLIHQGNAFHHSSTLFIRERANEDAITEQYSRSALKIWHHHYSQKSSITNTLKRKKLRKRGLLRSAANPPTNHSTVLSSHQACRIVATHRENYQESSWTLLDRELAAPPCKPLSPVERDFFHSRLYEDQHILVLLAKKPIVKFHWVLLLKQRMKEGKSFPFDSYPSASDVQMHWSHAERLDLRLQLQRYLKKIFQLVDPEKKLVFSTGLFSPTPMRSDMNDEQATAKECTRTVSGVPFAVHILADARFTQGGHVICGDGTMFQDEIFTPLDDFLTNNVREIRAFSS